MQFNSKNLFVYNLLHSNGTEIAFKERIYIEKNEKIRETGNIVH